MDVRQDLSTVRYSLRLPRGTHVMATAYRTNTFRNWYKVDQVTDSVGRVGLAAVLNDPDARPQAYDILRGADSGPYALLVKANNRNYQASGALATVTQEFKGDRTRHMVELGARLHSDLMDRYQWNDGYALQGGTMLRTSAGTPGTESNRILRAEALALHAQYDLWIGALHLRPGVRHERIVYTDANYGTQDPGRTGGQLRTNRNEVYAWMPGVAADLTLREEVRIFAGVHRGFGPPGATPNVAPELNVNYEAGVRWAVPGTEVQAIGYMNNYEQLLGADLAAIGGTGTGDLFNGGRARTGGLELFVLHDILHGRSERLVLPVRLAYTYTDARFTSAFASSFDGWGVVQAGQPLPYVAPHQLHASARLEGRRAGGVLELVWNSDMPTNTVQDIPAFTVMDISAFWRMTPACELFGAVRNALDERYLASLAPAGARPGLPRTLQAGARFRF
jgi:Fe(3+) dicitrate transport protein